jgi:hypothetical protein
VAIATSTGIGTTATVTVPGTSLSSPAGPSTSVNGQPPTSTPNHPTTTVTTPPPATTPDTIGAIAASFFEKDSYIYIHLYYQQVGANLWRNVSDFEGCGAAEYYTSQTIMLTL